MRFIPDRHRPALVLSGLLVLTLACTLGAGAAATKRPANTAAPVEEPTAEPTATAKKAPTATPSQTAAPTQTPQPSDTATLQPTIGLPGTISGTVWQDKNKNGKKDSGEDGFASVALTLGTGNCPSFGLLSDSTGGSGAYFFANILPGTYCVTLLPGSSLRTVTTANPVQVVLGSAQNKVVNFGLWQSP
jgi:hypothetical protein